VIRKYLILCTNVELMNLIVLLLKMDYICFTVSAKMAASFELIYLWTCKMKQFYTVGRDHAVMRLSFFGDLFVSSVVLECLV